MSGSFDRPAGQGGARTLSSRDSVDDYLDPPPTARSQTHQDSPVASEDDLEFHAERRSEANQKAPAYTPIVPAGSVTGRSLTLVITIMCFLACLTAGAVYMINQSAAAWLKDIASEVTVQIEPRERADTDRVVTDVTALLASQPGIRSVRPLTPEESAALIEPWLGQSDA